MCTAITVGERNRMHLRFLGFLTVASLAACGPRTDDSDAAILGERPYRTTVPSSYTDGTAVPLVVLLHGFSSNSAEEDAYLHFSLLAKERGFLLALPEGTLNVGDRRFWDATDACCNFLGRPVDDVGYLEAVIKDVKSSYSVDDRRVFVVGHSNGGFMAHRFACDRSAQVAAIVSLAGANWKDVDRCQPTEAVSVLQLHGTSDSTILYGGGAVLPGFPSYPSAQATVEGWSAKNRCASGPADSGERLDLDTVVTGAETRIDRAGGCPSAPNIGVELWTLEGGGHVPTFTSDIASRMFDFLQAHPKP